jgi:hypothetical protein
MKYLVVLIALAAACGSKNPNGTNVDVDASAPCGVFGATCGTGTDCCDGVCTNGMCGSDPTMCTAAGGSCAANTDCCTDRCDNGVCSVTQCTADGATCATNSECCGGTCNGTCDPLNASCKTAGNPCTASTDCCSNDCDGTTHVCTQPSFCVQNGDSCAHDTECCGGICNLGMNGLGTCTQPQTGATNCSAGIDGTVCSGCGDCCSRLCAPYGASGVKVCQPAEGCRIDGDLCHQDADCCGGDPNSGLPGAGHVQCLKEHATDNTGICRNPMACDPEGDVCHYKDYATCGNSSARNDCCGGTGNSGVCQLDALGVPRCYGLGTCVQTGGACAFSGDCCDGTPCVPDANGALHCGAACSPQAGACTASADCCNGETCTFPPGSLQGTCGGATTTCAQYGQACSSTVACCDGATCNVTGSDPLTVCPAGETDCTCSIIIF